MNFTTKNWCWWCRRCCCLFCDYIACFV